MAAADNVAFLSSIGQKTSGSHDEVEKRKVTFKSRPKLIARLRERQCHLRSPRVFNRELAEQDLPRACDGPWRQGPFPVFTKAQLEAYANPKLPGIKSMLRKAKQFFYSRKV